MTTKYCVLARRPDKACKIVKSSISTDIQVTKIVQLATAIGVCNMLSKEFLGVKLEFEENNKNSYLHKQRFILWVWCYRIWHYQHRALKPLQVAKTCYLQEF